MDPEHTGDMLKHLEKQDELLMNSYRSMSHYLHKLQVEEEMLMRKYYELMMAHGQIQKKEDGSVTVNNIGLGESENIGLEESENIGLEESENIGLEESENIGLEESENIGLEESEPSPNDDCNEK